MENILQPQPAHLDFGKEMGKWIQEGSFQSIREISSKIDKKCEKVIKMLRQIKLFWN